MTAEDRSTRRRYPLERGWVKNRLIREIALTDKTQAQLAETYGASQPAVSQFAERHATEIEAVRAAAEDKLAGMWITDKAARLAEYQQDVEDLGGSTDLTAIRIRHNALRLAAEELGQIPQRITISGEVRTVSYVIEGVNPEDVT